MKRNPPPKNVRRVRSTGVNNVGHQIGLNGEIVQTESMGLERLHFFHLLRNPNILEITSQPLVINYLDENYKHRTYTPDFLISFSSQKFELHECTLEYRRKNQNIIRREKAGDNFCKKRKWTFVIITPEYYPCNTTNANIVNISPFRFDQYKNQRIKEYVQNILIQNKTMSFREIVINASQQFSFIEGEINTFLFHYIWKNDFIIDWKIPIFVLGEINKNIFLSLPQRNSNEKLY